MKMIDILNKGSDPNENWWLNTSVKSPQPDPRRGPDAGVEDQLDEFNILVDGKLWKRNGVPVPFYDIKSARKAVDGIKIKYGKIAQIVRV